MSLFCADGGTAEFPPYKATEQVKRGAAPPTDPERDRCQREGCRKVAWQHWTVRP